MRGIPGADDDIEPMLGVDACARGGELGCRGADVVSPGLGWRGTRGGQDSPVVMIGAVEGPAAA